MFLDDSAVSAAGMLHSALILTNHALEAMSTSKNPTMRAQRDMTELVKAQVSSIISNITTSSANEHGIPPFQNHVTDSPQSLNQRPLGLLPAILPGLGHGSNGKPSTETYIRADNQLPVDPPTETKAEISVGPTSRVVFNQLEVDFTSQNSATSSVFVSSDSSFDSTGVLVSKAAENKARLKKKFASASPPISPLEKDPATPRSLRSSLQQDSKRRDAVLRAQEAFRALDEDNSGFLDETELRTALIRVGVQEQNVDDKLRELLGNIKAGDECQVSLETFAKFVTSNTDSKLTKFAAEGFDSVTDQLVAHFNKKQEEKVIGDSKFLIDPRSRISANWDLGVGVLLIVTVITMPLSMAFAGAQQPLKPLDVAADVIFILDITKNFNCGYIDECDFIIMDTKQVRLNYLKGWFMPDLFSSLPVELLDLALTGSLPDNLKATKALKLLRLSRLAKVFRILKLPKLAKLLIDLQDGIEDHFQMKFDEAKIAMTSLFIGLMVVAHWVGCISFMVAREFNFPEDSWVVNADLVDASLGTQYSWTMFRALMTMIGAGFESPPLVNTVCVQRTTWCTMEHWNTLICLYIGSVFYALLISSVSEIMSNMNKGGSALNDMLWGLNEFLAYKKVPMAVKNRVRSFYRIQYADGKVYDETKILENLPPNIKDDIVTYIRREVIEKIPLLSADSTPDTFVTKVAPYLQSRVVFSHEGIIKEGSTGEEMYFIDSGIVQVYSKHCDFVIKALADGCYFGDVACILGCKRTATIRSRTVSSLHILNRESLLRALIDHPDVYERMLRTARKRQRRMLLLDESIVQTEEFTEEDLEDEEDSCTKYFIEMFKEPEKSTSPRATGGILKVLSPSLASPIGTLANGRSSFFRGAPASIWPQNELPMQHESPNSLAGRDAEEK